MSLPAVDTSLVAPLDPSALMARLPARTRADLAWTEPALQRTLESLYEGPFEEERLQQAMHAFFELVRPIAEAVYANLPTSSGLELTTLGVNQLRTRGFLHLDPHTRDMALDALTILTAITNSVSKSVRDSTLEPTTADSFKDPSVAAAFTASPLVRSYVLLLAANKPFPDQPERQAHAGELVAWAFLMLSATLDRLARVGMVLDPFAGEAHGERTLRAAEAVREVLDDEDLQILSEARMRDLR